MKNSDPFTQNIKQQLDQETLPEDVEKDLVLARRRALQQSQQEQPGVFGRYALPAMAFAFVCAIAIAITLVLKPVDQGNGLQDIDIFEIITSRDELEMYENLEFYLWLNEEMNNPFS